MDGKSDSIYPRLKILKIQIVDKTSPNTNRIYKIHGQSADEDEGFEAYFPGPRFAGPVDTEFFGGRDDGDLAEEGEHDKREGLNHAGLSIESVSSIRFSLSNPVDNNHAYSEPEKI